MNKKTCNGKNKDFCYKLLKQLPLILTCTFLFTLTAVSQDINPIPVGKIYVLTDISSTTNMAGQELVTSSDNPQIVLSWNLDVKNVKDYHIYLEKKGEKPIFLGRTGSNNTTYIWSSKTEIRINPAFKNGPQDGESYRFQVYALTEGIKPVVGPFQTDGFVTVKIKASEATPTPKATSTPIKIPTKKPTQLPEQTPTKRPTLISKPTPTPADSTDPVSSDVIVTDSVTDTEDLSNGQDTDIAANRELVIQWNLDTENVREVHLYVSVNGDTSRFLGRTDVDFTPFFVWKKGLLNVSKEFIDGPQDGNSYEFSLYALTESGFPFVLGPYTNAGPVAFSVTNLVVDAIEFGEWIEEDGVWKNRILAAHPGGINNVRLRSMVKIGDYFSVTYIRLTNDLLITPIEISPPDPSDTTVEAILQKLDVTGEWIDIISTLAKSALKPGEIILPTPTMEVIEPTPTITPTVKPITQQITKRLVDIPLVFHRRAADLLEELRGSEVTPAWKETKLADRVYPFYRPDVEGVAYYEFTLIPQGAIVVSTGKHDDPLMSLNGSERGSIGDILMQEAEKNGMTAAKLYKLDSFGFVAETDDGQMAASFGNLPRKISGIDPSILDQTTTEITEVIIKPSIKTEDDSEDAGEPVITITGPEESDIVFEKWASWAEFRDSYSDVYQVLIDKRMNDVAQSWEAEEMIQENGIVLMPKQYMELSLLFPDSQYTVEGEGAQYVGIDRLGDQAVLSISANNTPSESSEFSIVIIHPNNQEEKIKFFLPNPEIVEIVDTMEEQAIPGGGGLSTQSVIPQGWGSWSSWTYYYAGNSGDQRMYYQFTYDGCASGCGATAWAMLFGWADNQAAEGNAYWAPRWGLYRENGGYGADAVAPTYQDSGIENITEEISDYIDTFCAGSSGATYPWKMDDAYDYIENRSGTGLSITYNFAGVSESRLREDARNSIRDRETPAVIGTGWLEHYPLAWAYAWKKRYYYVFGLKVYTDYSRYFKVNQGWGGSGDGWESASTWFAGEIDP